MSFLLNVNEVKLSGFVTCIQEKKTADEKVGLLIKLRSKAACIEDVSTEKDILIRVKISSELRLKSFSGINEGDELLISGMLVVDEYQLTDKNRSLDYMQVVATDVVAHIPKPAKGYTKKTFIQN